MAENPERKLRHEAEEAGLAPEEVAAPESAIESPEQKREREYQENAARLLARAARYWEDQRKAKLSSELPAASSPASDQTPLPTIADAKEQRERSRGSAGIFGNLRERVKRTELRFAGVENPDDLMALVYYLEHTLTNDEHHYIHVESSKKDREIEKYIRKGYEVDDIHDSYLKEGEVEFTIRKKMPYRVSSRDQKKLIDLLGKANDPVATIERLKRVGFVVGGHTIRYQCDALRDFVASPEIDAMLEKLERAGLKTGQRYFGYNSSPTGLESSSRYPAEQIKEYALDPRRQEEMSDENLQRMARLKQMGFEMAFDEHWDAAIQMASDDNAFTLLTFMGVREQREVLHTYPRDQWSDAVLLRDAGLADDFAEIIRISPWLAKELLYELGRGEYYRYSFEERDAKKIENANALLALPTVQEMRADSELAAFIEQVALLRGERISLQNAELYKSLKEYPEAIPLLELCRELGISSLVIKDIHRIQSGDLHSILANREILEDLFRPEFREFASRMKEGLYYQIRQEDLIRYTYGHSIAGQVVELSRDPVWREGMASGRAPEIVKKFGEFHMDQSDFYTPLLKTQNSLEVLEQLEQKFRMDFSRIGIVERGGIRNFNMFGFNQLCEDSNLRDGFFKEHTIAFYQRVKNDFGYEFNFHDANHLLTMSQDAELAEKLVDPDNASFIKEAFASPQYLQSIARIKDVDEKFKPLIRILAKEFHLLYGDGYDAHGRFSALYEAQDVVLPLARRLKEFKVDFNIIQDVERLKKAAEHNLPDLFERIKEQPALCSFLVCNVDTLVKDNSDVRFIGAILGKHGRAGDALIRDYARCLEAGAITVADKGEVLELSDSFRILSPAIITEYVRAKQSGTREVFLTHLKGVAEKLTGSETISGEEKRRPYFQDLLREVYSNNSGNWTNYANNESCEDRSADIAAFRIRPRYEMDLLSASEIKVKAGETLDAQTIESLKQEIFSVAEKMRDLEFDAERSKVAVGAELDAALGKIIAAGGFKNIAAESAVSPEEKLFLVMTDASYGTRAITPEELRSLEIFYEFAHFEDIRDYMQGTSERVSRARNPEYALLCELNTFFSDRMKEVNRRLVEAGFSNEAIRAAMPEYFNKLSRDTLRQEQETARNRMQTEKLGLNDDFIRQIARTLRGNTGKTYTAEQTNRLIRHYESLTKGLQERASASPKQRTKAFYGQLKSQRDRTLQAIKTLTGRELMPAEVHLGQINMQELLDAETNIREGAYDEDQFASYTIQKFLNIFGEEQGRIEQELDKFQSDAGKQREILFGYITKSKESAHARMVGGVCVCGDNPQKVGQECMWNMPNYFQLVLQDPETYRCVGPVLLHHFTDQEGKKILTASFNPSSTYLYGADETALFKGLTATLETFARENHFDMILLSKSKQIRTNRTGGVFEREMDALIAAVNKEYTFDEPKRFSYSPSYFMDKMDVIWEQ